MTKDLACEALQRLTDGNLRYAAGEAIRPNATESRRLEVAKAPRPFAMILGCVDSRVPPEVIFDCGLGDLLVIRTAGHAIDRAVLGSLELGVTDMGIPLLLVLGHDRCRAVEVAIEILESGTLAEANLGMLVKAIRPAVRQAKVQAGDLLANSIDANVRLSPSRLATSPVLEGAMQRGDLKVVAGRYAVESGLVELMSS